MSASLDGLPAETQLQIFHLLVPEDPNNPERRDLANLRLTCKAVRACATSVYFEHYYLLIRKEANIYVEPRSHQLFLQRPDLAALVKTVWIAYAAATPKWLRKQSAFGYYKIPTEDEVLEAAYMSTNMYKWAEDMINATQNEVLDLCRKISDFSPAEYESIREYYRIYIASDAYTHEYGLPHSIDTLRVLLRKRLRVLSNLNQVRIARPPVAHTPFYKERYEFWANNGLEDRAKSFLERRSYINSSGRFPWHSLIIAFGLEALPSTCKTLELDIILRYQPVDGEHDLRRTLQEAAMDPTRLEHLSLVIEHDDYYYHPYASEGSHFTWTNIINQFRFLSRLEIRGDTYPIFADHDIFDYESRQVEEMLPEIVLPNLSQLSIKSWVLRLSSLFSLEARFPRLRVLEVAQVALGPASDDLLRGEQESWHKLAKRINQDYRGDCALLFGPGPFIEYQGGFYGECSAYSGKHDPAIMGVLKRPVMEVLSAISQATTAYDGMSDRYLEMTKHDSPDTQIKWRKVNMRCENGDCEPKYTSVETVGMRFMYYDFVDFNDTER